MALFRVAYRQFEHYHFVCHPVFCLKPCAGVLVHGDIGNKPLADLEGEAINPRVIIGLPL
jgi:hypothetical protein